ncbi:MAG: twin-arginine translocase TatA/TatE family subunit [Stellaceae bacterium]
MDFFSVPHLILILVIVVVLFGAGKMPRIMGDFAKGIKAFKTGMKDEDEPAATAPPQVAPPPASATAQPSVAANQPREHA